MKIGIRGNPQPESFGDFIELRAQGALEYHCCVSCMEPFDHNNTKTPLGWVETQISGMCEDCFDQLFEEK